jgi:hypothetical protein
VLIVTSAIGVTPDRQVKPLGGAFMRKSAVPMLVLTVLLTAAFASAADCDFVGRASSDELVDYLAGVTPDEDNSECITLAVRRIESARYELAVPALIKLIDFRRPPTALEREGIALRPKVVDELYPAASALERIGKSALPALVEAIESPTTSTRARENAVSVWMVIYKHNPSKGVTRLRQESTALPDSAAKENLKWALSEAQSLCDPSEKARCKTAAATPKP